MKYKSPLRLTAGLIAITLATFLGQGSVAAAQQQQVRPKHFDIADQLLATALNEFARQSDRQILFSTEVVHAKQTQGVKGELEPEAALRQLLEGTGLTYRVTADNTILVESLRTSETATAERSEQHLRLAQADRSRSETQEVEFQGEVAQNSKQEQAAPASEEAGPQQIVVTGTNIRGIGLERIASPAFSYDQEDIRRSGVGTLAEFIQTIPQNFSGGISESSTAANVPGTFSPNGEAFQSFNLRGVGPDATLTLINGRRTANAGSTEVPTISALPASLIERIDIVADGASGIYGADAVGGVVNIVMRRDFDGLELRGRSGTVTSGHRGEHQLGGTAGRSWPRGNAFVDLNWSDRDPLSSDDRAYTNPRPNAQTPFYLIPAEELWNLHSGVTQQLGPTVLSLHGSYFERAGEYLSESVDFGSTSTDAQGYTLSGQLTWDINASTSADLFVDYSDIDSQWTRSYFSYTNSFENTLFVAEAVIRARLMQLAGGTARVAGGVQIRQQRYSDIFGSAQQPQYRDRDVSSAFAELFVPLIGPQQDVPWVRSLNLIVAGRLEDFSDFGSVAVPKFGVSWSATDELTFRGTYSQSFVAPTLGDLYADTPLVFRIGPDPMLDPSQQDPRLPAGQALVAHLAGANPDLVSQDAETFTAGFDFRTSGGGGLMFGGGFYQIEFSNRITSPAGARVLLTPSLAVLVTRPPNVAQLEAYFSDPSVTSFFNITNLGGPRNPASPDDLPFGLDEVQVFYDARAQNLAVQRTQGLDFYGRYRRPLDSANLSFGLAGQYILKLDRQVVPGDPFVVLAGRAFNPADLVLRGTAAWQRGSFSTSGAVNYTDSLVDTRTGFEGEVGSFTTIDLNIGWDAPPNSRSSPLNGVALLFTVRNLFDQEPDAIEGEFAGFDVYNSSPLGRVVSLSVSKRW